MLCALLLLFCYFLSESAVAGKTMADCEFLVKVILGRVWTKPEQGLRP